MRFGSHSRTRVGMAGCMMATPKPVAMRGGIKRPHVDRGAARPPASAAITMPMMTARLVPIRAISSDPGTAAMAKIASGSPISSPTCVSDMCNSACTSGITGGMARMVMRMATPAEPEQEQKLDQAAGRRSGGGIPGKRHGQ